PLPSSAEGIGASELFLRHRPRAWLFWMSNARVFASGDPHAEPAVVCHLAANQITGVRMKRAVWVWGLGVCLVGCATIEVNGIKADEGQWRKDEAEVRRRASFDLHCPASELQPTLLNTSGSAPPIPWTIGVQGCGKQATYQVAYGTGWVMNNAAQP